MSYARIYRRIQFGLYATERTKTLPLITNNMSATRVFKAIYGSPADYSVSAAANSKFKCSNFTPNEPATKLCNNDGLLVSEFSCGAALSRSYVLYNIYAMCAAAALLLSSLYVHCTILLHIYTHNRTLFGFLTNLT